MQIPKQAKKVFTGEIFDVYQWPQKMFDGSTEIFEMLDRPDTLHIIPVIKNKILIAWEKQPGIKNFYTLLGGRQNKNETPLEGARRELLEESGYETKKIKLHKQFEPYKDKMDWVVNIFIAQDCKKITEQKLDVGEDIKLELVNFNKFIKIILSDQFWGSDFALYVAKLKTNGQLNQLKKQIFG